MHARTAPLVLAALAVAALAGCSTSDTATTQPTVVTVTVPAPTPTTNPDPVLETEPAAAPVVTQWAMPNVIGMNLQGAQDHLQAVTDYGVAISTSTDATGQGRQQILDRNWTVCKQTPAAGSTLTSGDVPDFVVVKDDESC
jgi:hypothetical protein